MPGGGKNNYHHSFLKLGFEGKVVPFDAAGALWQFASHHAWDYLRGNYTLGKSSCVSTFDMQMEVGGIFRW